MNDPVGLDVGPETASPRNPFEYCVTQSGATRTTKAWVGLRNLEDDGKRAFAVSFACGARQSTTEEDYARFGREWAIAGSLYYRPLILEPGLVIIRVAMEGMAIAS